ncbi:MAG: hypothetical protein AAF662_14775 [Pseudomonadota bacterium]
MFSNFIQSLLLHTSDGFARWLYGSETCVALFLTIATSANGADPSHLVGIWYALWNITQYYDNQRDRRFREFLEDNRLRFGPTWLPDENFDINELWSPNEVATACMIGRKILAIVILVGIAVVLIIGVQKLWMQIAIGIVAIVLSVSKGGDIADVNKGRWP